MENYEQQMRHLYFSLSCYKIVSVFKFEALSFLACSLFFTQIHAEPTLIFYQLKVFEWIKQNITRACTYCRALSKNKKKQETLHVVYFFLKTKYCSGKYFRLGKSQFSELLGGRMFLISPVSALDLVPVGYGLFGVGFGWKY